MATERPIERLATALQDCLDEAAHKAAREVEENMQPKFEAIHGSLRQVWKAVNGKGTLAIDEEPQG